MMTKRIWLTGLAVLLFCLSVCGCTREGPVAYDGTTSSDVLPIVIDEDEFIMYENVFTQHFEDMYDGERQTREGVLCAVYDHHDDITRYFVWGYSNDRLKKDWYWELKVSDPSKLPPVGSQIRVTGTIRPHDEAMYGRWMEKPSWTVLVLYMGEQYDVNMAAMGVSLEMTQLAQMHHEPGEFEGKRVSMYGRITADGQLRHPHSTDGWTQKIDADVTNFAVDTMVLVSGVYRNGVISEAVVTTTNLYGS